MEWEGVDLRVGSELSPARFLGQVSLTRDEDVLTVRGRRGRRLLYRCRELVGGALLLTGSVAMVVAASGHNTDQGMLASACAIRTALSAPSAPRARRKSAIAAYVSPTISPRPKRTP
jgi:hypothetical protein